MLSMHRENAFDIIHTESEAAKRMTHCVLLAAGRTGAGPAGGGGEVHEIGAAVNSKGVKGWRGGRLGVGGRGKGRAAGFTNKPHTRLGWHDQTMTDYAGLITVVTWHGFGYEAFMSKLNMAWYEASSAFPSSSTSSSSSSSSSALVGRQQHDQGGGGGGGPGTTKPMTQSEVVAYHEGVMASSAKGVLEEVDRFHLYPHHVAISDQSRDDLVEVNTLSLPPPPPPLCLP
jgi:hypothetical protein